MIPAGASPRLKPQIPRYGGHPLGRGDSSSPGTEFRGHFHGLYSLGEPVCDLEPGTIPASDPNILEKLKLCPALTGAQRDALNALLLSGDTAYG